MATVGKGGKGRASMPTHNALREDVQMGSRSVYDDDSDEGPPISYLVSYHY